MANQTNLNRTLILTIVGLLFILPAIQSYPIKAVPFNLQSLLNADASLQSDLRRLDRLVEAGRFKRSPCRDEDDCLIYNLRELVPFV